MRPFSSLGRVPIQTPSSRFLSPHRRSKNIPSASPSPFFPTTTRLFGQKRTTPGNPPGKISIYNEQTILPNIDLVQYEQTIQIIRDILGYTTYDITFVLTDDETMKELNKESRGVDSPTDILSFPLQDVVIQPGMLDEPDFDLPEYYHLGDIFIDVPYVIRRCKEDEEYYEMGENTPLDHDESQRPQNESEMGDDNDFVGADDDERGVSGAMAKVYDPEKRIHMLLVHGMLHLVGYDHIEDEDYLLMVAREEEVLHELDQRTKQLK